MYRRPQNRRCLLAKTAAAERDDEQKNERDSTDSNTDDGDSRKASGVHDAVNGVIDVSKCVILTHDDLEEVADVEVFVLAWGQRDDMGDRGRGGSRDEQSGKEESEVEGAHGWNGELDERVACFGLCKCT